MTLYATKACTDQIRSNKNISVKITSREFKNDLYIVSAEAKDNSGRTDESLAAVHVGGMRGDALANSLMKCETKAKRRVTLSICGLGMLDETEIETTLDIKTINEPLEQKQKQKKVMNSKETKLISGYADYVPPEGHFRGRRIGDIPIDELTSYKEIVENAARKAGKQLQGIALDVMTSVTKVIEEHAEKERKKDGLPF